MVNIMIKIIEQEISFDDTLKKKLEFICDFCNTTPKFINGSIRKIDKTNLSYIEPYRIIINDITFLAFNYSTDIYIKNLNKKINVNDIDNMLYNYITRQISFHTHNSLKCLQLTECVIIKEKGIKTVYELQ